MATNAVATAFVSIVPSMAGFEGKLRSQLGGEMDTAGTEGGKRLGGGLVNAAKSFIGPLVATFGAFAAVDFFKGSIEAASTLAESQNAIKVTFGEAAGAIATLGEDSATRLGLSTSAFNGIATQFSAFAGTIAGAGGDVSKVVDELSTRGADFASVMNLDVKDALGLFQSGLAGETEPLRKYGIDMSAAAVEAYALSKGIWDGAGTMTEAQKVQARYGSLMEQTSKTAGDFANTSDGLANSQRIANAELENARAEMGDALLPVMSDLTKFAAETFIPIIEGMGDAIAWVRDNANIVVPVLAGLAAALLVILAPSIWAAVTATWAFTTALLANPIVLIALGVGVLIAALVALIMNWDAVVAFVSEVWDGFVGWLTDGLNAFAEWWGGVWDGIAQFFANVFDWIGQFIADWWPLLLGIFTGGIGLVVGLIIQNWDAIVKFTTDAFNAISQFIADTWDNIVGFFSAAGAVLLDWWNGYWSGLIGFFQGLFSGIGDFIGGVFQGAVDYVKFYINSIIDLVNGAIDGINGIGDAISAATGGAVDLNIGKIPHLAKGGLVTGPTVALIGEAGPEVVTPLKDFERMTGAGSGQTINYYAAPNESLDAEQALATALKRAKVLSAW
jgi:phage-related protein